MTNADPTSDDGSARAARLLILGAAGRDFHTFNTLYRGDATVEVTAFTAQQIPNIADRRYPPELAGEAYPEGIPIHPEERLEELIRDLGVDRCVLAYSDLSHEEVMHLASRAHATGADFELPAPHRSMLRTQCPVVAISASRTGTGKSQTARVVARVLGERGYRVGVLRHPMPYGDLVAQRVQRFASEEDLVRHRVTIEEREEYEPHMAVGSVVFAGVEYAEILAEAEKESDVLLWDGGNNDTPFLRPDLHITVVDPHRPGHELRYHPGETNLRMADVVVINKVDTASREHVLKVRENVRRANPGAQVVDAASPPTPDAPELLVGRRVLCIEDGPTLTHGGMEYGAATLAAREGRAAEVVDPRPYCVGDLGETFRQYPHIGPALPAMGYGPEQVRDLEATVARAVEEGGVEAVAVGTPIALDRLIRIPVPTTRVRYELEPRGSPDLEEVLDGFLAHLTGLGAG